MLMGFIHIIGILSTTLATTTSAGLDLSHEFQGARSAAMGGAHRGLADSNDALIMNPAGMAGTARFAGNIQYTYNNFYGLSRYHISVMDSKTGPVAGGLAYTYDRGNRNDRRVNLHRIYLGMGYSFNRYLTIGTTNRYVNGYFDSKPGERNDVSEYSTDLGIYSNIGFGLSAGLTYHNLIHTKGAKITTPGIGIGLAYQLGAFAMVGDLLVDLRDTHHARLNYNAGAEYFLYSRVPLRIGYKNQPYITGSGRYASDNQLTAGIGYVDTNGSIDITYAQSFNRIDSWDLTGSLQFFF